MKKLGLVVLLGSLLMASGCCSLCGGKKACCGTCKVEKACTKCPAGECKCPKAEACTKCPPGQCKCPKE